MLGGGSGGGCVFEEAADGELGEHFLLNAAEDFGEVDLAGVGSAGHDGSRIAEETSCWAHSKWEMVDGHRLTFGGQEGTREWYIQVLDCLYQRR